MGLCKGLYTGVGVMKGDARSSDYSSNSSLLTPQVTRRLRVKFMNKSAYATNSKFVQKSAIKTSSDSSSEICAPYTSFFAASLYVPSPHQQSIPWTQLLITAVYKGPVLRFHSTLRRCSVKFPIKLETMWNSSNESSTLSPKT